jgi:hypothetical protein
MNNQILQHRGEHRRRAEPEKEAGAIQLGYRGIDQRLEPQSSQQTCGSVGRRLVPDTILKQKSSAADTALFRNFRG